MEIYLVRHTKTIDLKGICFGQTDVETAESFAEEAEIIKNKLPARFDAVFSSPLKRCRLLAEAVQNNAVRYDERLMELNFGRWEMMPWDDMPQDKLFEWLENYVTAAPPGGESFTAMYKRVMNFFEEVIFGSKYKRVLIIAHAGVVRSVLSNALKIDLKETFSHKVEHGCIMRFNYLAGKLTTDHVI